MRSQIQSSISLKLVLVCSLFLFLLLFIMWSTSYSQLRPSSSPQIPKIQESKSKLEESESESASESESESESRGCDESIPLTSSGGCSKIPPSLAQALVHYVTTNITPQQTLKEISVTLRVLEKKSPCNFLVFGLGHDSLMWASLNHGGRTLFLEEDKAWIKQIKAKVPSLEAYHVSYETKVHQAETIMEKGLTQEECRAVSDPRFSKCDVLAHKGFPADVYDTEWDLIMVDAPTGYHEEAPGRMTAIYTAGLMGRNRESGETDVFVHDVDRPVEDKFSLTFLCQGYLTEQEGRIRHFTIPSHRPRSARPFCPS